MNWCLYFQMVKALCKRKAFKFICTQFRDFKQTTSCSLSRMMVKITQMMILIILFS